MAPDDYRIFIVRFSKNTLDADSEYFVVSTYHYQGLIIQSSVVHGCSRSTLCEMGPFGNVRPDLERALSPPSEATNHPQEGEGYDLPDLVSNRLHDD
jgi:hypothetical protein